MKASSNVFSSKIIPAVPIRAIWLAIVLFMVLNPMTARATTNRDLVPVRDGVATGAPKSECMIVANLADPIFTTSDSGVFRLWPTGAFNYINIKGNQPIISMPCPTITFDYRPPASKTTFTTSDWFQLDYPKGLLDNRGNRHDLHIRFDNISVTYREAETAKGLTQIRQAILGLYESHLNSYAFHHLLFDPRDNTTLGYAYSGDVLDRSVAVKMRISLWYDDDGKTPSLLYTLYGWDIDMPDTVNYSSGSVAAAWTTDYSEHFAFTKDSPDVAVDAILSEMSGSKGVIHVEPDTLVHVEGGRVVGSGSDDSTYASGFSSSLSMGTSYQQTGLRFWWGGSRCGSTLLDALTHALVARTGQGGHAWIIANDGSGLGSDRPDVTALEDVIELAETGADEPGYVSQRDTDTIPKNDYTVLIVPSEGYRVSSVSLDGTTIDDATTPISMTDFGGASVSFEDGGWARVSVTSVSTDHVVRALFEPLPEEPVGTLSLAKSSSNPGLTEGNASYSLEGARYGVYADQACEQLEATLVTNEGGTTEAIELPEGTHYVREISASAGYLIDRRTHEATVTIGENTLLELTEDPGVSEWNPSIGKHDAETASGVPQGNAMLSGARFEIGYFDTQCESIDDLPEQPTRSWTIETNAQGHAELKDEFLVTGDELYLVEDRPVIPIGTVVVREVAAPEGYRLPKDTLVSARRFLVAEDGVTSIALLGEDSAEVTVDDEVLHGGFRLKKVDSAGRGLAGAVFSVTNTSQQAVIVDGTSFAPGSVCLEVESAEDGIAQSAPEALPYGSYEIREERAPEGHRLDKVWKAPIAIDEDGQIVDLTETPLVNEPLAASVRIQATKRFDGSSQGRSLEPGMFTFVLANENGETIDTKTNDAEGTVTFRELTYGYDSLDKEYVYTVSELAGTDEEVAYDSHVETIRVRVQVDESGDLVCTVETDQDGIVFENRTVGRIRLPLTGLDGAASGTVATCAAAGLGSLILRRRMYYGG